MNSRVSKIILALVLLGVVGVTIGYFQYNKPHEDLRDTTPDEVLSSAELFEAFETDEAAANVRFLDKVLEVSGEVIEVRDEGGNIIVVLTGDGAMFGVNCALEPGTTETGVANGDVVTIRGRCSGYTMDVVLSRCVLL